MVHCIEANDPQGTARWGGGGGEWDGQTEGADDVSDLRAGSCQFLLGRWGKRLVWNHLYFQSLALL